MFNLPFHCRVADLKVRIGIEEDCVAAAQALHFAPSVWAPWQKRRLELLKELNQLLEEPNYWLF